LPLFRVERPACAPDWHQRTGNAKPALHFGHLSLYGGYAWQYTTTTARIAACTRNGANAVDVVS
jgi:hypothetical protein